MPLPPFLTSKLPAFRLLRQVLLFAVVDVVYLGFSLAYAFTHYGLLGPLAYLAVHFLMTTGGFIGAFVLMRSPHYPSSRVLRVGIGLMLAGMLSVGATGQAALGMAALTLAGLGRGMVWGARTWLEMHHTKGESRESYLALLQTAMTAFKLVGPLCAAALMYVSGENFRVLFAAVGVLGFLGLALLRDRDPLFTPLPGPIHPLAPLFQAEYWKTAPFYLSEGAGAALRQVLFVSGTLTVVASVSAYGIVDALSSLAAAACLVVMSRRVRTGPSLGRLQFSLGLVALSWLFLLGALALPLLLAGFVICYAFGSPLLATVKSSLVLKGLTGSSIAPHNNAMARQVLMLLARSGALALGALLALGDFTAAQALAVVVGLVLLLTPLEYYFAQKLVRTPET
jgi:hypothetical protein